MTGKKNKEINKWYESVKDLKPGEMTLDDVDKLKKHLERVDASKESKNHD